MLTRVGAKDLVYVRARGQPMIIHDKRPTREGAGLIRGVSRRSPIDSLSFDWLEVGPSVRSRGLSHRECTSTSLVHLTYWRYLAVATLGLSPCFLSGNEARR